MISVELSKRFKKIVREAGREAEVSAHGARAGGVRQTARTFGAGDQEAGEVFYQCRTGLAWRLIFQAQKGVLTFDFAGDHDEVQSYLRSSR